MRVYPRTMKNLYCGKNLKWRVASKPLNPLSNAEYPSSRIISTQTETGKHNLSSVKTILLMTSMRILWTPSRIATAGTIRFSIRHRYHTYSINSIDRKRLQGQSQVEIGTTYNRRTNKNSPIIIKKFLMIVFQYNF